MPVFTSPRRTPPDLKWLLNERASVQGAIDAKLKQQATLEAKIQSLQNQLENTESKLKQAVISLERHRANLAALDTAMAMTYEEANPAAGGSVQAWAGRYGSRGSLSAYILEILKAAAPNPLTMPVLLDMAARNFEQTFQTPQCRRSFRKSVRSALHLMRANGTAEALHDGKGSTPGQWRWKSSVEGIEELEKYSNARGLEWR